MATFALSLVIVTTAAIVVLATRVNRLERRIRTLEGALRGKLVSQAVISPEVLTSLTEGFH